MKTNNKLFTIITLVVFVLFAGMAGSAWAYEQFTNNGNGVRVTVEPENISAGQSVQINVRLNTHSVNLGQDLAAVSELRDNEGHTYKANQWNGSPPGGHHRSGTLIFPALNPTASIVTLIIHDVAGVPERSFTWTVRK